jgi:predicted amidohydrolase
MSAQPLSLRLFQICSTDSFEKNINTVLNLLESDSQSGDFCVFPENALYINIDTSFKTPELDLNLLKPLQDLCWEKQISVSLGSMPIYKNNKLFNRCFTIDEEGELKDVYDKIHLFKANVGPLTIDEGDVYTAGALPSIIHQQEWKVGMSVCFDLRFSDLYSYYAKNKCDLILVPSAFLAQTGKAHWEVLLRARAIETQSFVVASAQVGVHTSVQNLESKKIRKSYGHSLVISPWGEVLCDLKDKENLSANVVLDPKELKRVRDSIVMDRKFLKL